MMRTDLREAATQAKAVRATARPIAADQQTQLSLPNLLHSTLGNATIARMLAQREGAPEEDEEQIQAKHDATLQRDADEEEDQIQAMPEVGLAGGPVSDGIAGRINAKRGAGASLDAGTRLAMEAGFGASFGDVRLHTDAEADSLNRSISAKAFTTGSDIFFRRDASPGDQTLLAHELTHVVQQRGAGGGGSGMTVGPAGDSHEQEADAMAASVVSGGAAQRERDEG